MCDVDDMLSCNRQNPGYDCGTVCAAKPNAPAGPVVPSASPNLMRCPGWMPMFEPPRAARLDARRAFPNDIKRQLWAEPAARGRQLVCGLCNQIIHQGGWALQLCLLGWGICRYSLQSCIQWVPRSHPPRT
jgi:hypothetical protein